MDHSRGIPRLHPIPTNGTSEAEPARAGGADPTAREGAMPGRAPGTQVQKAVVETPGLLGM